MSSRDIKLEKLSEKQCRLLALWLLNFDGSNLGNDSQPESRKHLIAYCTTKQSGCSFDTGLLRDYLKGQLPEHMIPEQFVTLESIPRLPNGKINSRALPSPLSKHQGNASEVVQPRSEIEQTLGTIWSELLQVDHPDVHDNFFEFGGDSILIIQFVSRARESGLNIEPSQLAEYPTLEGLAGVVSKRQGEKISGSERSSGEAVATPIQQWFLNRKLKAPHHWNQSRLFAVNTLLEAQILDKAICACVDHHDALRANFTQIDGIWMQRIPASRPEQILETIELESLQDERFQQLLSDSQSGFNLSSGSLVRFIYVQFSNQEINRLLVVAHHLVIDTISWSILMEDIERVCGQIAKNDEISLPAKTASTIEWVERLTDYSMSQRCEDSLTFWCNENLMAAHKAPVDREPPCEPDEASSQCVSLQLDSEHSRLLRSSVNAAYGTQTQDLLLAALVQVLSGWLDATSIMIDLEGHGRELVFDDVELTRTIGWMTSFYPVTFELSDRSDSSVAIKTAKERMRAIPNRGLNFGVAQYLSTNQHVVQNLMKTPKSDVLFNFAGTRLKKDNTQPLFRVLDDVEIVSRDPSNQRSHILEINARMDDQHLTMSWIYSQMVHDRLTIIRLAERFNHALEQLVDHCTGQESKNYTPSDFPDSGLDQDDLDNFLDNLS